MTFPRSPSLASGSNAGSDAVALLDELVRRSVIKGASDIHLEPKRDRMLVRLRVDGAMVEDQPIHPDVAQQVVSRVKVLARMDIAERRLPQDGQLTIDTGPTTPASLRASSLP